MLPPRRRGYSRSDRCGQACYLLDEVIGGLDKIVEDEPEGERHDDAEALRDELDDVKGEAECLEFPGMYG